MIVYALLALSLVVGGYLLLRGYLGADPRLLAQVLRGAAVVGGGAVLIFLAVTGRLAAALAILGALAPVLLNWRARINRDKAARGPTAGRRSRIATPFLAVELDHDTGAITGEVLNGSLLGRRLETLSPAELDALLAECQGRDPQAVRILEAVIDRAGGSTGPRQNRPPGTESGQMDRSEALAILGLTEAATRDEIRAAHRRLMQQFHPDRGGSDWLASRINQAKALLLGR